MRSTSHSLLNYLRVAVGAWRDDPRDDATLLARFAEGGDEAEFRALVWRHGPLVWQTCRHILGDTPDAEDAFQTTFLTLAHKAGRFPVASLAGWLHRVARRAAMKADTCARRRRVLEQRLRTETQPAAEEDVSRAELYAVLDEELADLPERLRVPLVLRYLEGKTLAEVAQILGCSLTPVTKRLARGEAMLRARLQRRGLAVGVESVAALLMSLVSVSAVPACLIGSTARAAVAFRSGVLTDGVAEAVRGLLRSLPPSLETTIMRKSLWVVLACVCSLGVVLAAWQTPAARPDAAVSPMSALPPKVATVPGNGPVDCDGNPLPPGALARLGTRRLRHVGRYFYVGARSVVFSRDGKMLLTAGLANPIRLWDAATGKLLRSFGDKLGKLESNITILEAPGVSIALSPDGKILAARDVHLDVSLWEVATGRLLRQLGKSIGTVAFSRDGQTLLSAGGDNHLRVWEVATGKQVHEQPLRNAEKARHPSAAVFSPDGKILAKIYDPDNTNNTNIIYLWKTATGEELRHLSLGKREIYDVAFSPDGRFLVVGSNIGNDGAVHLLEVATGEEVRRWAPDKTGICSVAFSPNSKVLATGSRFGPIRFWEAATGKELRRCDYQAPVVALAFSPDGSTLASLAGPHDYTARLWEVVSGKELVPPSGGHVGPVLSVAFSPDGKGLISGGKDGLIGLWNAETGQEQRTPLRAGDFQAVAVPSPDGKTFLTVSNIIKPNFPLYNLFLEMRNLDSRAPTQVCVWDTATGQKLRQFEGPVGATAQSPALSPDGKILVLSSYTDVYFIEVATGKVMHTITNGIGPGKFAALSPDGKTVAVFLQERPGARTLVLHFYSPATGKELGSIKVPAKGISCLAFSLDGQTLAVGEGDEIRLWRLRENKKEWKEFGTLIGHQHLVWELRFSPDGKTLASACHDGTVRLWEVATGQERCRFAGHGGQVWCVAFAPDGRRLATGGNDTTILIWDVTSRLQDGQLRPVKLSAQQVKGLWADLVDADASRASRAIWTLAAVPAQTLPLLREHLRPIVPASPRIVRLIADLGSDTFVVRQKAMDELAKLGEVVEPALRQALVKQDSLEMRRRLEQLLEPLQVEKFPLSDERLRSHRALEVLEQMGTPEAVTLLETLARGAPTARRTLEAKAILERLGVRVNATKP